LQLFCKASRAASIGKFWHLSTAVVQAGSGTGHRLLNNGSLYSLSLTGLTMHGKSDFKLADRLNSGHINIYCRDTRKWSDVWRL